MPQDDLVRFGETITEVYANKDSTLPIRIAIIRHHGKMWIDIRRMWYNRDGFMQFGKGARLEIDNGEAAEAILIANTLIGQYTVKEGE